MSNDIIRRGTAPTDFLGSHLLLAYEEWSTLWHVVVDAMYPDCDGEDDCERCTTPMRGRPRFGLLDVLEQQPQRRARPVHDLSLLLTSLVRSDKRIGFRKIDTIDRRKFSRRCACQVIVCRPPRVSPYGMRTLIDGRRSSTKIIYAIIADVADAWKVNDRAAVLLFGHPTLAVRDAFRSEASFARVHNPAIVKHRA
jgi:hypothetical protein